MSPKSFLVLALATLISVGLAAWAALERETPVASLVLDEPLLPELSKSLDAIAEIEVMNAEGSITARRGEDGWVLQEKDGYPVDAEEIRTLVLSLANTRLVEAKTADPARHHRLELAADGSKARRVVLKNAAGEVMAATIVGKQRYGLYGAGRSGSYVRRDGEDQTWLADRALELPAKALDWLEREIVDLGRDEVARVTLGLESADPVTIARTEEETDTAATEPVGAEKAEATAFVLEGVADGRQADPERLKRVAGLLSSLNMQDVAPRETLTFAETASRARFETIDGDTIEITLQSEGEGDEAHHWVSLTQAPATSAEGQGQPTRLVEDNDEWVFEVSRYVAERLRWRRDDLLVESEAGAS